MLHLSQTTFCASFPSCNLALISVSQCYDGASVMSGSCSGVSARIKELNPKAVYIHCCAHRLNLALVDTVKSVPVAEDFFFPSTIIICFYGYF